MAPDKVRLQKYLARSGVASRRACEHIILAGRVSVNGTTVTELGSKVSLSDVVCVDGAEVHPPAQTTLILLHKPQGYLTSMKDPFGRPCVSSLVPTDRFPGLFAVGRLDLDTTGLLLFTDDGELGNALLHPRKEVGKTYEVQVAGTISDAEVEQLCCGIELEDGLTAPAQVCVLARGPHTSELRITIHEGRKRQIKRMCDAIGHSVQKLHRISFAGVSLGDLPEGAWRFAASEEREILLSAAGLMRDRIAT